ncbi:hypothetical protein ACFQ21_06795 [Ohtaekwangia kribbensis]|uniref:Uncharacterized protein n=1 Tax=Ohtaekwangia kribbensis TaxID=688913 RepID=A0ABW3JYU5_9BACT
MRVNDLPDCVINTRMFQGGGQVYTSIYFVGAGSIPGRVSF